MNIDWYVYIGNKTAGFDYDMNKDCTMIDGIITYHNSYEEAIEAIRY